LGQLELDKESQQEGTEKTEKKFSVFSVRSCSKKLEFFSNLQAGWAFSYMGMICRSQTLIERINRPDSARLFRQNGIWKKTKLF
jgi:hypothetical protein